MRGYADETARRILIVVACTVIVLVAGPTAGRGGVAAKNDTSGYRRIDSSSAVTSADTTDTLQVPDYVIRPWRSLRGHLHNKVIHIPIGFALSALFISLLAIRYPELEPAIRWLVVVAAVGSIAAFFTGSYQANAYVGSSKEWVVDLHRAVGISTAAALWAWAAMCWIRRLRKWSLTAGVAVLLLITLAGFLGGVIAHG